jgi:hypothetical protein
LLLQSNLYDDEKLWSLLPQCTPVLYRLLMIEIKDLIRLHTAEKNDGNEFPSEVYEQKTVWHNFAKGEYLQSQNALYESLMAKLPRELKYGKSTLYNDTTPKGFERDDSLMAVQSLRDFDPYSKERIVEKSIPKKPKPKSNKIKNDSSQSSTSSQTQTVVEPAPIRVFPCFQSPPPFPYHNRVMRWFRMAKKGDSKLERQRSLHAFHRFVDQLILEKAFTFQKEEKRGRSYYLVAQFNFEDGTFLRGIVNYGTFVTSSGKEKCYHRHLSEKRDDEFLQKKLEQIFTAFDPDQKLPEGDLETILLNEDADAKGQDNDEKGATEGNQEAPRIEFDPKLGLIKIHDKDNGLVISLFRMPDSNVKVFRD